MVQLRETTAELDGARHHPGALGQGIASLLATLQDRTGLQAGKRLSDLRPLSPFLIDGRAGAIARDHLGSEARPVRAVLFDKTPSVNWSLAWHQDRTIAVQSRASVAGFRNWTVKQGIHHTEPPFDILSRMITLRIHLDEVGPDNAPLRIAPGSHRYGLIAQDAIASVVAKCGTAVCLARAGDIWSYSTPILHASEASSTGVQRRVLQVEYSADQLPAPLEWLPA